MTLVVPIGATVNAKISSQTTPANDANTLKLYFNPPITPVVSEIYFPCTWNANTDWQTVSVTGSYFDRDLLNTSGTKIGTRRTITIWVVPPTSWTTTNSNAATFLISNANLPILPNSNVGGYSAFAPMAIVSGSAYLTTLARFTQLGGNSNLTFYLPGFPNVFYNEPSVFKFELYSPS